MSSYGRPPSSEYEGHDSYSAYEDTYAMDSYGRDPYPQDPYAARESARGAARAAASVGSAGRARVAPPSPGPSVSPPRVSPASPDSEPPRPRYDWSTGGRSSGRATVPVSPAGPVGPVKGRAVVQPGGPGGPGGPAGTGPGAAGPGRPAKKKKRHWFRNTVLIMLAVSVITIGGGMVALSYYVDSVPAPQDLPLAQGSTIYFANGDEMATLQEVNREIIDTRVPELANMRNAVVAAEDQNFYEHSGVDFMGIVRAAFTNTTGSADRSGASTIDMQYTRAAAGLTEDSYSRKLREAAMAYKLNQEHDKDEILDFYLNQIYLGRGAYGVEAAARAYYDKPAAELSAGEAALLAGIIRNPASGEESGLSPYDPWHEANQENPQVAFDRWSYVLDQMVDTGALPAAERAQLVELPETIEPQDPDEPLKGNQGMIVKQIQYELERMNITDVETGGYRITTTIDREVQRAAVDAARRTGDAPYWDTIQDNIRTALVAIDPATGGVVAYWGGTTNGTGIDLAGPNRNEEGVWYGGRPPGSSAKIYTLIAEMRRGVSFDSFWETGEYDADWADITVRNAGRTAEVGGCEGQAPDHCSLRWVTQESYNVPFARFAERVPDGQGPAEILDAAMDAGITMMTDTEDGTAHQLADFDLADTRSYFDMPIAYGQYPVTALDHANGFATLAAHGIYNRAHFVDKVEVKGEDGEWQEVNGARINGEQQIEQAHADAITGVLSTIPGLKGFALEGGRPAAAKTGTWEHVAEDGQTVDGNADAWVAGYTPQLASAVWVGDPLGAEIEDIYGNPIGSSGLPAQIWQQFMSAAHAAMEYDFEQFPPAPPVGDRQSPLSNGPPPVEDDCRIPFLCDDDDDDDEDNGGGNGNQGQIPPPGDGGDTDEGGGGG